MIKSGKVVWGVCFVLLLSSTPLLVRDLLQIQRSVEQTSGADFWYEGQLKRELLRLKVALIEAKLSRDEATIAAIRRHLDLAFSRLNTLPRNKSSAWHTQGIADLPEIDLIRAELESVDAEMPLLETRASEFLDNAALRIDAAMEHSQAVAIKVVARQNALTGEMQAVFHWFRIKLSFYAAGFVALIMGLAYLMYRHTRSESGLRAAYHRVAEMTGGLTKARDDAIRANRAKSNFLANVSHELRTPLNAIIGYSEMLAEDAEDEGRDSAVADLQKIHGAGRHLLTLINDVLDLSKIEAGKMELYLEHFEIRSVLDTVVTTVTPLVGRNGNTLVTDLAAELGTMHGDMTRLRQILLNLLSNASKFTERGTIRLRAERARDADREWLVCAVSDTGIGMTEEQLGRLFQAFAQAEASTAARFGGTGLGLIISRSFAEMMGGRIDVTSTVGEGTTFTVRVPLRPVAPPREATRTDGEDSSPTVLVIDDEATARDLVRRLLEREGFRVLEAADGASGLALARAESPALITLDVLMPGMDGWAVLGALKQEATTSAIPVIMVSVLDEQQMGFALGAADYVTKPVERARLLAAIEARAGDESALAAQVHALIAAPGGQV